MARKFRRTVLRWHEISEISAFSKRCETFDENDLNEALLFIKGLMIKDCVRAGVPKGTARIQEKPGSTGKVAQRVREVPERHAQGDGPGNSRTKREGSLV
jgi:hypothetical protein